MKKFLLISLLVFSVRGEAFAADPQTFADKIFKNLKDSLTVSTSSLNTNLPVPKEVILESSPKIKEANKVIEEETGINLSKFVGWLAKIMAFLFGIIVKMLQEASELLKT